MKNKFLALRRLLQQKIANLQYTNYQYPNYPTITRNITFYEDQTRTGLDDMPAHRVELFDSITTGYNYLEIRYTDTLENDVQHHRTLLIRLEFNPDSENLNILDSENVNGIPTNRHFFNYTNLDMYTMINLFQINVFDFPKQYLKWMIYILVASDIPAMCDTGRNHPSMFATAIRR